MDGGREGTDRSGELRGRGQYFRGCSANGVVRGLLTVWRHKFTTAAGVQAPGFVPVRIACEGGPATTGEPGRLALAHTVLPQMASPPGKLGGVVEIEMSGARIRVEPGVELATLSTVLSALRGIR